MNQEIFIVDDEIDIRTLMRDILLDEGYIVREFSNANDYIEALQETQPVLVLLDIWLKGSDLDGLQLLEKTKKQYSDTSVVMISGHGNIEIAVSSIRKGAYDFIEKPFNSDRLLLVVSRALQNSKLLQENKTLRYKNQMSDNIIGSSSKTTALKNIINKTATSSSRVLITGPAGVGKEVVARAIHNKSEYKEKPFIVFNSAGLNSYAMEAELFESYKNAANGTFVLDEVCDLPMVLQGTLLKLLQDSSENTENSPRIIAISAQDIPFKIEQGLFREDLYYRLNVMNIQIPPLHERKEDIEELCNYYINEYCHSVGIEFKGFTNQALTALISYQWEGNVRQLKNSMEWITIMLGDKIKDTEITLDMLPVEIYSNKINLVPEKTNGEYFNLPLKEARDVFEKEYIESQLLRFDNISKMADFIGMERTALHRKLKQLNIEHKK